MKALGITSTAILSLLLAVAAPAWSQEQHGQEQKDRPAHHEEKKLRPEKSAEHSARSAGQERNAKPQDKSAQRHEQNARPEQRSAQRHEQNARPEQRSAQRHERNARPEQRSAQRHERNARPEQRSAQQHTMQAQHETRQHGGGGRISDEHFRASFGKQHRFHVRQGDYDRDRRFRYGGYSFVFGQEWPAGWLYTDDVYVDYVDDGYYLYSPVHPGIRIAINIL